MNTTSLPPTIDLAAPATTRWRGPLPFTDAVPLGTLVTEHFLLRFDPASSIPERRAALATLWPLLQRPLRFATTDEYIHGRIVELASREFSVHAIGDIAVESFKLSALEYIADLIPITK